MRAFVPALTTGALIGGALLAAAAPAMADPYDTAVLQGLDKVTARVSTFDAPIGDTVRFGTLEIIARTCDKRPPEETPESAAFVDIWEVRPGEPALDVFRGWMFASSPALSAMEHGVYDVWVIDCKNTRGGPDAPLFPPSDEDDAKDGDGVGVGVGIGVGDQANPPARETEPPVRP